MTRDELIEKMCDEDCRVTESGIWKNYCDEDKRHGRRGMAAALDVVLQEVLDSLTMDEVRADKHLMTYQCPINVALEGRRAKYQKVKTAEERVTVNELENGMHEVYEDGNYRGGWSERKLAEAMRIGLIAQLKEGK